VQQWRRRVQQRREAQLLKLPDGTPCGGAGEPTTCRVGAHVNGRCEGSNTPKGADSTRPTEGARCVRRECNGQGTCEEQPLQGDKCNDNDPCTADDVCQGALGCAGTP
jgi:hypothetical protein